VSDAVQMPPNNEGIYRLLMEINDRVAGVESAQKFLVENLAKLSKDFETYKSWTQRLLYAVVLLLTLGAAILLALIFAGRI